LVRPCLLLGVRPSWLGSALLLLLSFDSWCGLWCGLALLLLVRPLVGLACFWCGPLWCSRQSSLVRPEAGSRELNSGTIFIAVFLTIDFCFIRL
jgi:hypothetical protein